jgi:hypothetical protein
VTSDLPSTKSSSIYICMHLQNVHPYPFWLEVLGGMAPKGKLTAALFEERYGNLVSEHFAQYTTARTLRVALSERQPPIIVTDGMLKIWFAKFRLSSDAADELHRRYGDLLSALAAQNPTAYRLMRVLKARTPPLYVSDAVLKQWFLRYFDAERISDDAPAEPPRKRAVTPFCIEGGVGWVGVSSIGRV